MLKNVTHIIVQTFVSKFKVINPTGYFDSLLKYPNISTFTLKTSMPVVQNISVDKYYFVTASDNLNAGTYVPSKGYTNRTNQFRYANSFTQGMKTPKPLLPYMLSSGIPEGTVNSEDSVTLTYIHTIPNAVVLPEGEVLYSDLQISPGTCNNPGSPKLDTKSVEKVQVYNEVFTVSAYWGSGFFHFTVEDLPRVAPFLLFLLKYPDIKIHVAGVNSFVEALFKRLGISKDRLVSGYVAGHIVYMPAGIRCGEASLFSMQLLSLYMKNTLPKTETQTYKVPHFMLIKRSARRWFKKHDDILKTLKSLTLKYGGELIIFDDAHLPSLSKTMELFNQANIIVAPHGAGLSNMMYAKPGTFIVEGLCKPTNMCYTRLAHILGHLYYGIIPNKSCFDTSSTEILVPVKLYLDNKFS